MANSSGKRLRTEPDLTDADIRGAIRAYLADPVFHEYVDRVEQLWDSIAEELMAEAAVDSMTELD